MKSIGLIALLAVSASMASAQTSGSATTAEQQWSCRDLASSGNFIAPDETYMNGMVCKKIVASPVAVAANVPEAKPARPEEPAEPVSVVEAKPLDPAPADDPSEYMTSPEIEEASHANPKWVTITAGSSLGQEMVAGMAGVNLVQEASIHLFTAQSWTAFSAEQLRRQYKQFTPASLSKAEMMKGLTVVGFGMAYGSTAGPQCASITRIALISDKSGEVVAEAVDQDPVPSTWSNAFGASATCQALVARFAEKDVERVSAAAKNGEYFVGVFSGENGRFLYKVKEKFLKQLSAE